MTRLAMTIDLDLCLGCEACMVACMTENESPVESYRLRLQTTVSGTFPDLATELRMEQCFQCEESPCIGVCPTGANYRTDDGVVLIDTAKCIGCKACVVACPYGMRYIHTDGYADKCTFCYHRVQEGRLPACVETCPTGARIFGDLEDPDGELRTGLAAAAEVDQLRPETGTRPRIFYTNTPLAGQTGLAEAEESEWKL